MSLKIKIFFILFGGALFSVWAFFAYNSFKLIYSWELTKWVIVEYIKKYNDGSTTYSPVVSYRCDGVFYKEESSISKTFKSYDIWEEAYLYCDESKFIFKYGFDKYFWLVFLSIGSLIISIPIFVTIYITIKRRREEELKRNWDYIRAEVVFVWYNYRYKINWKSPMYFELEYLDKDENKIYKFKSNNFWHNQLGDFIKVWDLRKVYLNRMNKKSYYVEIEDIPVVKN